MATLKLFFLGDGVGLKFVLPFRVQAIATLLDLFSSCVISHPKFFDPSSNHVHHHLVFKDYMVLGTFFTIC